MKKLLKEPLVHFLLLGALIFVWYYRVSPDAPGESEIVVSRGQQEHLVTTFSRTWQRPPTADEFNHLVDDYIDEEVAYRESLKMGLDTNDTIIRRRLRQKLELLAEDIVTFAEPTREQLQEYLDANSAAYRLEPTWSLQQVYYSPERRGDAVDADTAAALALLNGHSNESPAAAVNPDELGDPLPLPGRFTGERESALGAQFGAVFTEDIQGLQPGQWHGPVRSGFGLHLVYVGAYEPGRELTLDEAETVVRRDLMNERRESSIEALYERLRESYTIVVEPMSDTPAEDS